MALELLPPRGRWSAAGEDDPSSFAGERSDVSAGLVKRELVVCFANSVFFAPDAVAEWKFSIAEECRPVMAFDLGQRRKSSRPYASDGKQEEMEMSRYVVKFFKKVLSGTGHEVDACQFSFETLADSRGEAEDKGKKAFCNDHHLTNWTLHADRCQVQEANFPS